MRSTQACFWAENDLLRSSGDSVPFDLNGMTVEELNLPATVREILVAAHGSQLAETRQYWPMLFYVSCFWHSDLQYSVNTEQYS